MKAAGRARLALFLWAWVLRALAPLILLRWWWRGKAEPGYRAHVTERWGHYRQAPPAPGALWLHAVSLGETLAATPLVEALRRQHPGLRIVFTHTTATGREAGAALMRAGDTQRWLPLDTPGAVRRFLRHVRPALGVLMETEIWPQLCRASQDAGVPLVLANARLSARSLRRGQRFAALLRPAAQALSLALAQTEADAERLRQMGAPEVRVMGNLKFDQQPDAEQLARGRAWRAHTGQRAVLLWAVTREGEERLLLEAFEAVWPVGSPRPLLLVVPRHPQRFDEVAALFAARGMRCDRRSQWAAHPVAGADVWLGDTLGEMPSYYACADLALLGGSFAPLGGQNLIQAAACGCPLLMGPHTFNFAAAAEDALAAGAAERVADAGAALQRSRVLLAVEGPVTGSVHPELQALRDATTGFAARHQGAAERMASALLRWMPPTA